MRLRSSFSTQRQARCYEVTIIFHKQGQVVSVWDQEPANLNNRPKGDLSLRGFKVSLFIHCCHKSLQTWQRPCPQVKDQDSSMQWWSGAESSCVNPVRDCCCWSWTHYCVTAVIWEEWWCRRKQSLCNSGGRPVGILISWDKWILSKTD